MVALVDGLSAKTILVRPCSVATTRWSPRAYFIPAQHAQGVAYEDRDPSRVLPWRWHRPGCSYSPRSQVPLQNRDCCLRLEYRIPPGWMGSPADAQALAGPSRDICKPSGVPDLMRLSDSPLRLVPNIRISVAVDLSFEGGRLRASPIIGSRIRCNVFEKQADVD